MNTSSVLPAEQFDFFRSWYAGIAEATLFQEGCSSFLAHQMVWDFGKLTFIYLTLPYCQFGWRHLSRPTIDNWCLTLLLPKAQNSRDDFEVGDLGLQSFADPFEYISKKNDFLAFVLPRNLPFIQSSKIEIRRNSKQLLTDYMLLLHRSLPDLRSTDALNIAAATTSLLAACLAPSRDRIAEAQRPIEAVLMNRASQIIAKHLSDPKFSRTCSAVRSAYRVPGCTEFSSRLEALRTTFGVRACVRHVTRWPTVRTDDRSSQLLSNMASWIPPHTAGCSRESSAFRHATRARKAV
jgi:hypothetical protein